MTAVSSRAGTLVEIDGEGVAAKCVATFERPRGGREEEKATDPGVQSRLLRGGHDRRVLPRRRLVAERRSS